MPRPTPPRHRRDQHAPGRGAASSAAGRSERYCRMKSLTTMAAEVAALNTEKGWRTGDVSWGDHTALLHTEIAEATDAYRVRKLAEYTTSTGKPDDVASELADALIRLLDMLDVHRVALPWTDLDEVTAAYLTDMPSAHRGNVVSF